jgi:hypothetical protein
LYRAKPDPATWTIADLQSHNLEFVITKQAKAVYGTREATMFPIIDFTATHSAVNHAVTNDAALAELGVGTLQDAINPSTWKPVGSAQELQIIETGTTEKVIQSRDGLGKAIGQAIVILLVIVETAYFIARWVDAPNKIAHTAEYALNVSLTVGGYFACEALGTAMLTAEYSTAVIAGTTLGIGVIIAIVGILGSMFIRWLAQPYAIQEWVSDLFVEDSLFVKTNVENSLFLNQTHHESSNGTTHAADAQTMVGGPHFRTSNMKKHNLVSERSHPNASTRTGKSTQSHTLVSQSNHPTLGKTSGRSAGRPF